LAGLFDEKKEQQSPTVDPVFPQNNHN